MPFLDGTRITNLFKRSGHRQQSKGPWTCANAVMRGYCGRTDTIYMELFDDGGKIVGTITGIARVSLSGDLFTSINTEDDVVTISTRMQSHFNQIKVQYNEGAGEVDITPVV